MNQNVCPAHYCVWISFVQHACLTLHTHSLTRTYAHAYTHTHTHTHTILHAHTHTHTHTHYLTRTHTHALSYMHTRTCTHTHTRTILHAHTHIHTHTHTYTHTHTHTHTHTYTYTHTHTHTHTRTHTHTHTATYAHWYWLRQWIWTGSTCPSTALISKTALHHHYVIYGNPYHNSIPGLWSTTFSKMLPISRYGENNKYELAYVIFKKHFTKKCKNHSCRDALPQKQREQAITHTAMGSQTDYTTQPNVLQSS